MDPIRLPLLLSLLAMAGPGPETQPPAPETQRGPEVTGSRSDTSPPLRDIPPAKREPGQRVHPWRRIPRPAPEEGAADAGTPPASGTRRKPAHRKRAVRPRAPKAAPEGGGPDGGPGESSGG